MSAIELIRLKIESDIFDYNQLMEALSGYKKPRDVVSALLRSQKIIRIRKGLYYFSEFWQNQSVSYELMANLVYGPSAISLDYALSYYGLIPEKVMAITSVTPGRSRVYDTPAGRFSYTHLPQHCYAFGMTIEKTGNFQWLITQPLKALADKVWADKRLRPVSPASFHSYLFHDLRIDENTLLGYLNKESLALIKQQYAKRKVDWMVDFLMNTMQP